MAQENNASQQLYDLLVSHNFIRIKDYKHSDNYNKQRERNIQIFKINI